VLEEITPSTSTTWAQLPTSPNARTPMKNARLCLAAYKKGKARLEEARALAEGGALLKLRKSKRCPAVRLPCNYRVAIRLGEKF